MKFKSIFIITMVMVLMVGSISPALAAKDPVMHINVLLNTEITDEILAELGDFGQVKGKIVEINALTMTFKESQFAALLALPFVKAANPDAERYGSPVETVPVENFADGLSTWNLDVINVTEGPFFGTRIIDETGDGVYIAVLDIGLLRT